MTRKRFLFIAIAITILLAVPFLFPTARSILHGLFRGEAFYENRPTSYWSQRIREGPIPQNRNGYLVRAKFESSVPATTVDDVKKTLGLGHAVSLDYFPLRERDAKAIPVLIELLRDADPAVRMYAAETLGDLGPTAHAAVPALQALLDDQAVGRFGIKVSEAAAEAIAKIAIPVV